MIKGLDSKVKLEPISHTYKDVDGNSYMSVSKFLELFSKKFDREGVSKLSAKKHGLTQEEVLQDWDKKRDDSIDHGNRIHSALERFENSTQILPEDEELRPMILSVASEYSHYYRSYNEVCLYDEEHRLAGTSDKILQCTSHAKSIFDLSDYKTNLSKGIQFKNDYGQYMLGPLAHLQDCNYVKYSLQLSTYAYLLQKKTGCKIGQLSIHYIPAHNLLAHIKYPVPYMKRDVELMLEWKSNHAMLLPENVAPESQKTEKINNNLNHIRDSWDI